MALEELKKALDAPIDEHGFSGVVYVRRDGKVLYERAAGYADRSNKTLYCFSASTTALKLLITVRSGRDGRCLADLGRP